MIQECKQNVKSRKPSERTVDFTLPHPTFKESQEAGRIYPPDPESLKHSPYERWHGREDYGSLTARRVHVNAKALPTEDDKGPGH